MLISWRCSDLSLLLSLLVVLFLFLLRFGFGLELGGRAAVCGELLDREKQSPQTVSSAAHSNWDSNPNCCTRRGQQLPLLARLQLTCACVLRPQIMPSLFCGFSYHVAPPATATLGMTTGQPPRTGHEGEHSVLGPNHTLTCSPAGRKFTKHSLLNCRLAHWTADCPPAGRN